MEEAGPMNKVALDVLSDTTGQSVIEHVNSASELNAGTPSSSTTTNVEAGTSRENAKLLKEPIVGSDVINTVDKNRNSGRVTPDQDRTDNNFNVQSELISTDAESLSARSNMEPQFTLATGTDNRVENNEKNNEADINDNGVRNITVSCNSNSPEASMNKRKFDEVKQTNDNSVADVNCDEAAENSIEAMVVDDQLENGKVINESNAHSESSMVSQRSCDTEENGSNLVVDAMNKDQSWKTDRVYQKDLSSLKLLCDYGSDSDDNNEGDVQEAVNNASPVSAVPVVNPCPTVQQEYRKSEEVDVSESEDETDSSEDEEETSSSTSTATSSSSSEESEDSENSSGNECVIVEEKKPAVENPKTKGELGLDDLPPIEDLRISVPESECVEIGKVLSIVDSLVVVQSIKGCPALDLDSVLFLDHGHSTLGQVFDVFGKVGEACYCVRFNSKDHAIQKGVEVGMPVYYAPRTQHSRFVFLADLMKVKGSDASWEHNNEPPPKFLDYSDDEEERRARKGDKATTRDVEPDDTQPRTKKFNKRGSKRGGMGRAVSSSPPGPNRSWSTPFNRYPCPSPSPSLAPSPRSGPQPLIRPPAFRNPVAPQAHFHNAAAGAPAVPPTPSPSPWAVPPPSMREDFKYNINVTVPPPQPPFVHSPMMRPGAFSMNVGGFGQPPPQPLPPFQPQTVMMPTSIPGAGPFTAEPGAGFKVEGPAAFTVNQLPPFRPEFNSFRPDIRGPFGSRPRMPFGPREPIFMNRNAPPSQPPSFEQRWIRK